jgi:hypothetical protein
MWKCQWTSNICVLVFDMIGLPDWMEIWSMSNIFRMIYRFCTQGSPRHKRAVAFTQCQRLSIYFQIVRSYTYPATLTYLLTVTLIGLGLSRSICPSDYGPIKKWSPRDCQPFWGSVSIFWIVAEANSLPCPIVIAAELTWIGKAHYFRVCDTLSRDTDELIWFRLCEDIALHLLYLEDDIKVSDCSKSDTNIVHRENIRSPEILLSVRDLLLLYEIIVQ